MPIDVNGQKWSCTTCVQGHRTKTCNHFERWMQKVRAPGRPTRLCQHISPDPCSCRPIKAKLREVEWCEATKTWTCEVVALADAGPEDSAPAAGQQQQQRATGQLLPSLPATSPTPFAPSLSAPSPAPFAPSPAPFAPSPAPFASPSAPISSASSPLEHTQHTQHTQLQHRQHRQHRQQKQRDGHFLHQQRRRLEQQRLEQEQEQQRLEQQRQEQQIEEQRLQQLRWQQQEQWRQGDPWQQEPQQWPNTREWALGQQSGGRLELGPGSGNLPNPLYAPHLVGIDWGLSSSSNSASNSASTSASASASASASTSTLSSSSPAAVLTATAAAAAAAPALDMSILAENRPLLTIDPALLTGNGSALLAENDATMAIDSTLAIDPALFQEDLDNLRQFEAQLPMHGHGLDREVNLDSNVELDSEAMQTYVEPFCLWGRCNCDDSCICNACVMHTLNREQGLPPPNKEMG